MIAEVLLATTGSGLARAQRRAGDAWSVEFLLHGAEVTCLEADLLAPEVVFAGTQGAGVLRSDDRGKSWGPAGLAGKTVKSLAASRWERNTVFAGLKPAAIWETRDGGASWNELDSFHRVPGRWYWFSPAEPPFFAYVQAIALSPTDPETMLVGIEAGAVVRSTDGGKTWSGHRRGALRDCHSLVFHPADGTWAYEAGGSGGGAAVSRDGGVTWRQPKQGLDRHYGWACAAHPTKPHVWYVSASTGPFKAHGDGDARAFVFRKAGDDPWQKLGGGLPQPLASMPYALLADARAPQELYAGLANGAVWHSHDEGDSWTRLPLDLGGIHRTMILL